MFFFSSRIYLFLSSYFSPPPLCGSAARPATEVQCSTQTSEWDHVNSSPRGSAHNAYHSDLNSVTTDNFTNSWGSIKAYLKCATCHFYIRKHAVQNGTFSLVFCDYFTGKVGLLMGPQVPNYLFLPPLPPPLSRAVVKGWREGGRFTWSCL